MIAHRFSQQLADRLVFLQRIPLLVRILVTFQITCVGWMIFRAQNPAQVWDLLTSPLTPLSLSGSGIRELILCAFPLLVVQLLQYRLKELNIWSRMPSAVKVGFITVICALMMAFAVEGGDEFIYFQF